MRTTALLLLSLAAMTPLHAQSLAITGVTIVDPSVAASRQAAMGNQTVVVRNGVIEAVGPSGTTVIPRGTRQVDGRGKFLIPGLWDSHLAPCS